MRKGSSDVDGGRRSAIRLLVTAGATGLSALLLSGWSHAGKRYNPFAIVRSCGKKNKSVGIHANWYFFSDTNGNAVVFTGSHTWGRRRENKRWVSDGWDLSKFNRYLDFLQHWNHNYIRLWMWEQEGDVNIWEKDGSGKFDLSRLNQDFFELTRSFVAAARAKGIFLSVMLFQGWSGTCPASIPDWPRHPMHRDNNINGVHGADKDQEFGNRVHSLEDPRIVAFQEAYVRKMIDSLNEYDNFIWEIGNEPILSSVPWMGHMVQFIRDYEKSKTNQHLVLTGTGNGVGNDSIFETKADTFSPCVVTKWGSLDDPYIGNPPIPAANPGKPVILDNDHLGNHFLRYTPLNQRNWTWKSFTRGNHPIHMDCYDVYWDNASPTRDHPIEGVSTHPHYDPQRKSMGDVQLFAKRMDLAKMKPVADAAICSSTFCLMSPAQEYLAYQPDVNTGIALDLPAGYYDIEKFDAITSEVRKEELRWAGGKRSFSKPDHASEDWILYVKRK